MIFLIHKSQRALALQGKWIYFGQDFFDLMRWESILGKAGRISYADLIPDFSRQLRQPFIEWVSELGKPFGNSLDWWMTPLAGRVVMQTPIFLYLCYVSILKCILEKQHEADTLVAVCEDWFLLWTLEAMLRQEGYPASRIRGWRICFVVSSIRGVIRFCGSWLVNLWMYLLAWIAAFRTFELREQHDPDVFKKQVIIHTCIDDACFSDDGAFHDRYFTELPAWLESHGCEVTILPWLCNIQQSVFSVYRWFRQSRQRFIIPEDYLRLSDYVKGIRQIVRMGWVLRGSHTFAGHSVSPLIHRECIENVSAGSLRFLLNQPALERWLESGNRCDVFIDMFENMYYERPHLLALQKLSCDTLTVGYQHATIPDELVGYSVTEDEWDSGIFPKRIVTTGPAASQILIQQGFPRANVVDGPALRYSYLLARPLTVISERQELSDDPSMLVVLPLDLSGSVELIMRLLACRAILKEAGWSVLLKIHPMMLHETLMRTIGVSELPGGWQWVTGAMNDFLQRVAVVLGTGTGALLDAAIYGVPVICLGRELGFAYNPLERWGDQYPTCKTVLPHRLRERLEEILQRGIPSDESNLRELSDCIRAGLGQLDDDHFSAFI